MHTVRETETEIETFIWNFFFKTISFLNVHKKLENMQFFEFTLFITLYVTINHYWETYELYSGTLTVVLDSTLY